MGDGDGWEDTVGARTQVETREENTTKDASGTRADGKKTGVRVGGGGNTKANAVVFPLKFFYSFFSFQRPRRCTPTITQTHTCASDQATAEGAEKTREEEEEGGV